MKLKALLLGSAAAMIAVSGANAADAIVDEAHPVEYVRVCDMYGAGFFYIPGTETCLKLSGSTRSQYTYTSTENGVAGGNSTSTGGLAVRARINFDARNETDWGTLRSFTRLEGNTTSAGGAGNVRLHTSFVSVGGLQFGYGDDFFTTNGAYGHPGNMLDGAYNYNQAAYVQYTYAANGFSATAGFQGGSANFAGVTAGAPATDDTEMDYYVGGSYSGSWGRVSATYIYDNEVNDGAYAIQAEITPIENLRIDAWYQADDGNTQYIAGQNAWNIATNAPIAGSDEQWGVGVKYDVMSNFSLGAGYSERDGTPGANVAAEGNMWVVGFAWQPISGLNVQGDYQHFSSELANNDADTFRLRVTRSW